MYLKNIKYKYPYDADSVYEVAQKIHQNFINIRRRFGTGIIAGGKPELLYHDQTDKITIVSHFIFYKPISMFRTEPFPAPDNTVSNYTIVGDGTVNCWIEGSKVEFLPTISAIDGKTYDSTIVSELRSITDTTTDFDIHLPTKTIRFTTPILGFIGHDPIYYDATNEYDLRFSDGTVWISLDRDENFHETRTELDSTNYILLWSARFQKIHAGPEGKIKRLAEVRDLRTIIPNVLNDFKESHWKNFVRTPNDLPIAGSRKGDARFTTDQYVDYIWIYDTSNISSITGNFWNSLSLPKGTFVDKAFSSLIFNLQRASLKTYTETADSTAAILNLTSGQHIRLAATPSSDEIEINFEVDRNLDFNGLYWPVDVGRSNKIINVGNIDTTNLDVYGDLNIDGTFTATVADIKNVLNIKKQATMQSDVHIKNLDMTSSNLHVIGGKTEVGSHVNIVGDIDAKNINVNRTGNPPDNHYGLIQNIDITNHHTRHEAGGDDEINVELMKGVTRGQNAGWFQDRTISNENPVDGDVITWDGNYWSPVSRVDRVVELIESISLWNERKVPGKKPSIHNKFLKDGHRFTFPGKFLTNDQNETPPGNNIPMYSAWNKIDQKDIFAKSLDKGKLGTTPYTNAFRGTVFDGQYIYLAPKDSKYFVRYDTKIGFDQTAAYEALEITNIQVDATNGASFYGCTFDGNYIYFVPSYNNSIVRYKIGHRFTDATSWEVFDLSNYFGVLKTNTFAGAIYDGRFVYLIPNSISFGLRYDTSLQFTDPDAWISGGPGPGYVGGTFDGKYVYYSPSSAHDFVRFLPRDFTNSENWQIIDATKILSLDLSLKALSDAVDDNKFSGACYDGKYVYYSPYDATHFVRVNTYQQFNKHSSWQVVRCRDVIGFGGTWNPGWKTGFQGRWSACRFDGRYIYFAPENSPFFIKYDTQEDFRSSVAWDKVVFNMGDNKNMRQGYDISVHKYVEKSSKAILGTGRVLVSVGPTGNDSDFISHVLWGQENRRYFKVQDFIEKNRAHSNDTTFTDCIIKAGLIDRDGKRIWLFVQNDAVHAGDFIYEMDLDGVVLSRRRVGTNSSAFNYNYGAVDQVYGHVYVTTQSGVTGIDTNMRVGRLNYPGTNKYDRLIPILDNNEFGTSPINIFSAKRWIDADNAWESLLCTEDYDGNSNNGDVGIYKVYGDGTCIFHKHIICKAKDKLGTTDEYINVYHGGLSIADDGLIYGVSASGSDLSLEGSFFVWDSTNLHDSYPKLIRWSGYKNSAYTGSFPNVANPEGLQKSFGINWGLKDKLVTNLSKNEDWIYVNLWSTPARLGRINKTFTEVETWDGLWYVNSMGGLEVDGNNIYFIPADGRKLLKYKKPYKINLKSKLGWKASP